MALIATIGVSLLAAGTAASVKARRKQGKIAKRRADINAAQSRRAQVRERRIRQGRLSNQAIAGGVGVSSGFFGASDALTAQQGQNLSFLDRDLSLQRQGIAAGQRAATFGAIASIGGAALSAALPRA